MDFEDFEHFCCLYDLQPYL